jgi:hypothetical protein
MTRITETIDTLLDCATKLEEHCPVTPERRHHERFPFSAAALLILLKPDGGRFQPRRVLTRDISAGGVSVVSRGMIHEGAKGGLILRRSDGESVLVGVLVKHCRYAGIMQHHTGMEFIPLPDGLSQDHFVDHDGWLKAGRADGLPE